MYLSGYRCMWILVMFDLPTATKTARKEYAQFRKALLEDGFSMMQYSVYLRPCPSRENVEVHLRRIRNQLPPNGEVRILTITDKQFERMQIFWCRKPRSPEEPPSQLQLF